MLKEKDKQIEQLEREYHQGRSAWEKEEKLVVSAWHEMVGLLYHLSPHPHKTWEEGCQWWEGPLVAMSWHCQMYSICLYLITVGAD